MLDLKPARWFTNLKRSQPLWKTRDETHELLTEDDTSDDTVARWTTTPTYSISKLSLPNGRTKTLVGTFLLVLFIGIAFIYQPKATPVEKVIAPPKPWEEFER